MIFRDTKTGNEIITDEVITISRLKDNSHLLCALEPIEEREFEVLCNYEEYKTILEVISKSIKEQMVTLGVKLVDSEKELPQSDVPLVLDKVKFNTIFLPNVGQMEIKNVN